jgi:hypothetical protein
VANSYIETMCTVEDETKEVPIEGNAKSWQGQADAPQYRVLITIMT